MPEDDLTPAEEQVRRLLADARHTEPMPDDVAARLDEVLTGLREEPAKAPVRDLAAARRRRTVRGWLVAAAAVVVVGVGVNQIDFSGMSADDDSGAASSAGGDSSTAEDAPNEAEAPTASSSESDAGRRGARMELSAEKFGKEVQAFRRSTRAAALASTHDDVQLTDGDASDYSVMCDVGDVGAGYRVPVRYDAEAAWLVFRKPQGDSQVVDLYLCGSERPVRSITLPAP